MATRAVVVCGLAIGALAALAEQMAAYWTSFARTGKPVAPGAPAWRPFKTDRLVMRFEPGKVGLFDASQDHHCGFWKKLYPRILSQ